MNKDKKQIIFLGETHGFLNDFKKIKELTNKYSPKIILSEQLQHIKLNNNEKIEEFLSKKTFPSKLTNFKEIEPLLKLCLEKSIPIIGIDFKDFGYSKKIIKAILEELNKLDEKELEQALEKRTKKQIKKIKELTKNKKNTLIIIGAWHLRKEGPIRKTFSEAKYILPTNDKREEVFEPSDQKISFKEIKKNNTSS